MLRSGRLDKSIYVGLPDTEARQEILAIHFGKKPMDPSVDIAALAHDTAGYSCSDLKLLVDEAARTAVRRNKPTITPALLQDAIRANPPSVSPDYEAKYDWFRDRARSGGAL